MDGRVGEGFGFFEGVQFFFWFFILLCLPPFAVVLWEICRVGEWMMRQRSGCICRGIGCDFAEDDFVQGIDGGWEVMEGCGGDRVFGRKHGMADGWVVLGWKQGKGEEVQGRGR